MIVTKYVDRITALVFRRPIYHGHAETGVSDWAGNESMTVIRLHPPICRCCGRPAQLELTASDTPDRVEYLCYEDLSPFLEIFTDPRVREWTIVRMP